MVNSDGQITKPVTAVAETGKSKKKRPRVRVRTRNKAVRLAQQNTVDNSIDTKTIEQPNCQQVDIDSVITKEPTKMSATTPTVPTAAAAEKSREQILAEREAKKQAKQAKKVKIVANDGATQQPPAKTEPTAAAPSSQLAAAAVSESAQAVPPPSQTAQPAAAAATTLAANAEKSREQIKAEREAKKLAKQAAKAGKSGPTATPASVENTTQQLGELKLAAGNTAAATTQSITQEKKKPELTKAERRAIQEAQRAAKAQAQAQKNPAAAATTAKSAAAAPKATPAKIATTEASSAKAPATVASPVKSSASAAAKPKEPRVKLFNHLQSAQKDASLFINNAQIHPSITRLGEQYAQRTIVGSNARCIAFLNALKMVIHDFETPPKKEFARSLEATLKICVDHLQQCRPLAVSVCNAYKHINNVLTQLPADQPESDLKQNLCHFIETYIENQIGKAAQAISSMLQEKIIDGDVLLTFGCSSLIHFICEEAQKRKVDFRVIIVDSRPFFEGQELLRRLSAKGIPCTYVLINALGFVMPEATKVLLGAHALLSNGYVMARTGTAQVALVARSFNVPVLVCCETHKFSERFQTDAIVYNELGNPDDLCLQNQNNAASNALAKGRVAMLNLNYDITPPELVTAVVTEVSILPCTSVPVILRIKPTEIGYYC